MLESQPVLLGLGGNIGDRYSNLLAALVRLAPLIGTPVISPVYESSAWGVTDQASFLNCACRGNCQLPPESLLRAIKEIEHAVGRRPTRRWGERVIDIDILIFGDRRIDTPELQIPHPQIARRLFVCRPLANLQPDLRLTRDGPSVADLARDLEGPQSLTLYRSPELVASDLSIELR